MKSNAIGLTLCMLTASFCSGSEFKASFTPGGWNADDWVMVKSWRWPYRGQWIQGKDFIVNAVPQDASPQDLEHRRVGETYTSMVLNRVIESDSTVSCTMDFDYRMAPGLIIAEEPTETGQGPEYRNHYEIILFDGGINVWHHYFEDGKQKWVKKAFLNTLFKAKTPYELIVKTQFTARGPQMTLQVGEHIFGFHDHNIPRRYRVGIVASEGVNRFYYFKAATPAPDAK
jgi:hypothetical protein